jgi:hypothetical protein
MKTRKTVSRKGAKKLKQKAQRNHLTVFFAPQVFRFFAPLREISLLRYLALSLFFISLVSCAADQKQVGIPAGAQTTIDTVADDIANAREEKIYTEAAEEWRQAATLEQTKEFFKTLRAKLGSVRSRAFHTARIEQNTGSAKPVQTLTVQYQTGFERGNGMETFTLVEREGRWQLARYFVNSDALK